MNKYNKVSILLYESITNRLSINKIEYDDVFFGFVGNFILVEKAERNGDEKLLSKKTDVFNLEQVKSYKVEY